jgi:hypothetical protein
VASYRKYSDNTVSHHSLNHQSPFKVAEDAQETGKTGFVNFKRIVWHKGFYRLLETAAAYSKTGFWFDCVDAVTRFLFPLILILSADYEEQSVS